MPSSFKFFHAKFFLMSFNTKCLITPHATLFESAAIIHGKKEAQIYIL